MKYLTDWLVMSGSDSQDYQDNYDRIFNSDKKEDEENLKDQIIHVVEDDVCPHCKANLRGKEIPEDSRENYGNHTHFSKIIGVEIPNVYDGALFWQCPECGGRWHRFTKKNNAFT